MYEQVGWLEMMEDFAREHADQDQEQPYLQDYCRKHRALEIVRTGLYLLRSVRCLLKTSQKLVTLCLFR